MDEQQLRQVKVQLQNLKSEESRRGEQIREGLRTAQKDSVQELSLYDNHPADVGDVTWERAKDLGLILFIEERLAMIDDALEAIEKGEYGVCEICEHVISWERLEAIPYTTLCQDCKQKKEGEKSRRPVEESVIKLPFGGVQGYHEALENNAFDGEDAWQAVARYGSSDSPSDIGSVADYEASCLNAEEDIGTVEEVEKIDS
ncbi:MAG: TraR/DksA C4-type zinc finger protein [Clostridia bacterium]|nr:TraR/DksA C4-type zinc finger protein [Clostridia bacterium]